MGKTLRFKAVRLIEAAKYEFYKDKLTPEVFEKLNNIYPKYSVWIIDRYLKYDDNRNAQMLSDYTIEKLKNALDQYSLLQRYGYFKSVYSPEDPDKPFCPETDRKYADIQLIPDPIFLVNTLLNNYAPATMFLSWYKYRNYKKNIKMNTIYEDETWQIIQPENHEACIYLGSGETRPGHNQVDWCVSKKSVQSENYFKSYSAEPIVYLKYLPTGERFLIGGTENMVNNENNDDVDDSRHHDREWMTSTLPEEAIEKLEEIFNGNFLDTLLVKENDLGTCDRCGHDFYGEDDVNRMDGEHEQWCSDCYSSYSYTCRNCQQSYDENNNDYLEDGRNGNKFCPNCSEELFSCPDCTKVYRTDRGQEGDDGETYCDNCIADHSKSHTTYDWDFRLEQANELSKDNKLVIDIVATGTNDAGEKIGENDPQPFASLHFVYPGSTYGWEMFEFSKTDKEGMDELDKIPVDFSDSIGIIADFKGTKQFIRGHMKNLKEEDADLTDEEEEALNDFLTGDKYDTMLLDLIQPFSKRLNLSKQGHAYDFILFNDMKVSSTESTLFEKMVNYSSEEHDGGYLVSLKKTYGWKIVINPYNPEVHDKPTIKQVIDDNINSEVPEEQGWLHNNAKYTSSPVWESLLNIKRLGSLL